MDITRAWEVFTNYLNIMKNHPNYFEKAYPPTQLKLTYEQQVNHDTIFDPITELFHSKIIQN